MASNHQASEPRAVPGSTSNGVSAEEPSSSFRAGSQSRASTTARLASSPQPGATQLHPPNAESLSTPLDANGRRTSTEHVQNGTPDERQGRPTLASVFNERRASSQRSPTPVMRALSPHNDGIIYAPQPQHPMDSLDGTFDARPLSPAESTVPHEDPDIVTRHLVRPSIEDLAGHGKRTSVTGGSPPEPSSHRPSVNPSQAPDLDEFSSLQLAGGDVHRQVYRWAEDATLARANPRSKSFTAIRPVPEEDVLDISNIKVPGGFRRNFLRQRAYDPAPHSRYGTMDGAESGRRHRQPQPVIATNNFIEFLTLYGHFAGEELESDDEDESDDYFTSSFDDDDDEAGEEDGLITPRTPGGRKRPKRPRAGKGRTTPMGAALLLLKSFVGTGVLFLPKAFLNGGLAFSTIVLVGVAALSYYCFILLVNTRLKVEGSYGDMGGMIYGRTMRGLILASIVLSQFGFVSAYFVFVSQNFQAFVSAVSKCSTWVDIKWLVLAQAIIFLPLSLIRDISKLGFTALVADVFILLGLLYLYYFDISTIVSNGGLDESVRNFNRETWTGFIGTAIFTFEGIGLIIPIQESMRKPTQFPPVLGIVMIIITVIFTSMGALSYGAFGSVTKTVVMLNLPQDSKFVNAVQLLYSLAIMLSTPLQLFPAIRILESELFTRSGKNNPLVKWNKNMFRFFLVMVCALVAWGGASDLDKFVSIVGSFACVPLVYVYPPLLHYKATAKSNLARWSDIILSILGFGGMVYTTVLTAKSWGTVSESGPGYCDDK